MEQIQLAEPLLAATDQAAAENRKRFAAHGLYVINLMSGPGAGKTTLLERTLERLAGQLRVAVVVGDIQGRLDADRIARFGLPVRPIETGGACHIDPRQVADALADVDLAALDLLIIENVGNLVCPAEFDLGESERVMLLSVAEGHDKPLKYPLMFRTAQLLLVNKIDLLGLSDFDPAAAERAARELNPRLDVVRLSCRTGEGFDRWIDWLLARVAEKRSRGE